MFRTSLHSSSSQTAKGRLNDNLPLPKTRHDCVELVIKCFFDRIFYYLLIPYYCIRVKEDRFVDYNISITLMKVSKEKYLEDEEVFQVNYASYHHCSSQKQRSCDQNIFLFIDAANIVWILGEKTYMDAVRPVNIMIGNGCRVGHQFQIS